MYQAQRDQMAGQAFNVEQTAFAIDTVKDTQTTVAAMKAAAKVLKVEQKKIKISDVEDMQDDLAGSRIYNTFNDSCP
jgi:charged multivesicular body protein 5